VARRLVETGEIPGRRSAEVEGDLAATGQDRRI
jgi:hypothetical protein